MKKLITFVFATVLSLAVLNVMAFDKNSKKAKANKKIKAVSQNNMSKTVKTPDGKVRTLKAVTLEELNKKRKTATK